MESDAGATLSLTWGTASLLLPVGMAGEDLAALVAAPEDVSSSVLLVPNHGRAETTADEWLRIDSIWAAVLSVGAGNPSGDPALREAGYTLLRTGRNGWISFATDGERLWAETER